MAVRFLHERGCICLLICRLGFQGVIICCKYHIYKQKYRCAFGGRGLRSVAPIPESCSSQEGTSGQFFYGGPVHAPPAGLTFSASQHHGGRHGRPQTLEVYP